MHDGNGQALNCPFKSVQMDFEVKNKHWFYIKYCMHHYC